jgi:Uri superfamily endonuclease
VSGTTRPRGAFRTYQLLIEVGRDLELQVGALGLCRFPAGTYVYTGSARRNLEARVERHLRRDKPLRWHVDYLLVAPDVRIVRVEFSQLPECQLNARTKGEIPVPGFGASDCRKGCGSHLKRCGGL